MERIESQAVSRGTTQDIRVDDIRVDDEKKSTNSSSQ